MKKLIAHRGLKEKGVKENSLEAFSLAFKNENYVGFECDVRTTKDHVFVIHHNPVIDENIISFSNYQDLKKKYHLPRLEEVLSLSGDKIFLFEIKEHNFDVSGFLSVLDQYPQKQIYLMSFFRSVIKKMKSLSSKYPVGVLNYVFNSEESYQEYDFICLLEDVVTPLLVRYFKDQKIQIFLYGIHHFEKTIKEYPDCYFITDEVIK